MAAHARLRNESTEDEKNHNLMRWLILWLELAHLDMIFMFVFLIQCHMRDCADAQADLRLCCSHMA